MKITKKTQLTLSVMSFIFLFSCSPVERKTGDEISLKCISNSGSNWANYTVKIGINECTGGKCVTWDNQWINIKHTTVTSFTLISREDLSYKGQYTDAGRTKKSEGMCEILDKSNKAL